jgi:hypothetical protein
MGVVWGPLLAVLLVVAVVVWDRHGLARSRRPARGVPAVLLPLALPFLIPPQWPYARAMLTVLSVVMAAKGYELLRDRVPDSRMLEHLGTVCFWLLVPSKAELPASLQIAARVRAQGRRRLGRAVLKLPAIAALVVVHMRWPGLHTLFWLESLWGVWLLYLAFSAAVDVTSGLAMQTGIDVAEGFDAPALARSPRDFWGRRWNLMVQDMMFRHVFLPMGGLRRPLRATLAVFVFSGLVHEYFVFAALGHPSRHTGWMMLFFGLHGVAVLVQLAWDRGPGRRRSMPRALAVGLHLLWLVLTAPLFFGPLGELLAGAWPN